MLLWSAMPPPSVVRGRGPAFPKFLGPPTYARDRAGIALVSATYFHVEVLGSVPGQGEIFIENYSVSAARTAYSAVMSRLGLHLVEGIRQPRNDWPSPL